MLSLFMAIAGGVSWEEVIRPLQEKLRFPNRNPWKVQVDHLKNPMCFLHSLKPIAVGPVKDGAK